MTSTVVVLGARNLGGAIVSHFRGLGWNTVAVARSEETLERVRASARPARWRWRVTRPTASRWRRR
jgi:NAD(P)-dependent dehydrogenase (short-subunit alcohol dehydrogenase family)